MIELTKVPNTPKLESAKYMDAQGNVYKESEVYARYSEFNIAGRDRKTFEAVAKKFNARHNARHQVRANFGGHWDSGLIAKEILTDTLMEVRR